MPKIWKSDFIGFTFDPTSNTETNTRKGTKRPLQHEANQSKNDSAI